MALSFTEHLGDGTNTTFTVPFPYLDKTHIKVAIGGVNTAFTWTSPGSIEITPAPAAEAVVKVYRATPNAERLVDFADDSIMDEDLLDAMSLQLFYIAQEAYDLSASSIVVVADGNYDARSRRVKNVADPLEPTDAVNLKTFQSDFLPRLQAEADRATTAANTSALLKLDFDLKWAGILQKESDFNQSYLQIQNWNTTVSNNKDAVLVAKNAVEAMQALIEGYKASIEATRTLFNTEAAQAVTDYAADVEAAQTAIDDSVDAANAAKVLAESAKTSSQANATTAVNAANTATEKAQEATSAASAALSYKEAVETVGVDAVALQNAVTAAQAAADRAEAAEGGVVTWGIIADKPTVFAPAAHTHPWSEVTGKPATYPAEAHTHEWATIGNKPTVFAPAAHGHAWAEITGKPTFFSGLYADLSGIPLTFAPAAHTHTWADVTGKPTSFPSSWAEVSGKPGTFTPAAHGHPISDIVGLQTALQNASGLASGAADADPNSSTSQVIVTNHVNSPGLGFYWHITTTFYSTIATASNRAQIAVQYNGGNRVYARSFFQGVWTAWSRLDGPNITYSTAAPSGGVDGDIHFKL